MDRTGFKTPPLIFLSILFLALTPFAVANPRSGAPPLQTKAQIMEHCWQVAWEEWRAQHVVVDVDARDMLDEFIEKGVDKMIAGKQLGRLEEADNNLRSFCKKAEEYGIKIESSAAAASSSGTVRVTGESIKKARKDVCPVFPFCA